MRRQIAFCAGILLAGLFATHPAMSILPRGGVTTNSGNPDRTIPAPGQWLRLTSASQGNFLSQIVVTCAQLEGGDPPACQGNTAGSATATGSMSGTTTLTLTAVTGTINNGDVISGTGIANGTVVVSGGPLSGAGTLILNTSQTVGSESLVVNPAGLQASTIASGIICNSFANLLPFAAPAIDPNNGDAYYYQPGGHSTQCNSVGVMKFSIAAAKANGGTTTWAQVIPPARHVPQSYPIPGWQNNWGTISNAGDYYYGTNANGEYVAPASHTYEGGVSVTSQGYLTFGGQFPLASSGGGAPGNPYFIDNNYGNNPIGPLSLPSAAIGGYTYSSQNGYYIQGAVGLPSVPAMWGSNNELYSIFWDGSNFAGAQLVNPFSGYENMGTAAFTRPGFSTGSNSCWQFYGAGLVFPDPYSSGHLAEIERSTATTAEACGITVGVGFLQGFSQIDNGGAGGLKIITLSGTSPLTTDCGASWGAGSGNQCNECDGSVCNWSLTYDPDDGYIIGADGAPALEKITPNNTTTWPVGTLTTSTSGAPPPIPSATGCTLNTMGSPGTGSAVQYFNINGAKFVELVYCGDVYRYGISDNGCSGAPYTNSAIDNVILYAAIGRSGCELTDSNGHVWSFGSAQASQWIMPGTNYQVLEDGSPVTFLTGFKIERIGGNVFVEAYADSLTYWTDTNLNEMSAPGASPQTNAASIGATNYTSLGAAVTAVANGQTIQQHARTGANFWVWNDADLGHGNNNAVSGVTIGCDSGVALYAARDGNNNAIINLFAATNTTITGCELGYDHSVANNGPYPCLNIPRGQTGLTYTGGYIHDCDMGVLGGGNNGTLTFTNVVWDHNGGDTGSGAAAHNIYFSYPSGQATETTTLAISGGGSYCMKNTKLLNNIASDVGFEFKSRVSGGTIQNFTIAEPSQHLYSDCNQSTAVDISCGGQYTFGGTTAGTGVVIELGPDYQAGPRGIIRYTAELTNTSDCPTGGTGYATNTLLVQNCWAINDTGATIPTNGIDVPVVYGYSHGFSMTVKNCKIVNPYATSLADALGPGVTDGGGNTLYASRAAAGLSAYPALPAPT